MRPQTSGPWRKAQREASRGIPTRRAVREARITAGKDRIALAGFYQRTWAAS